MLNCEPLEVTQENLPQMPTEQLVALIVQLRGILRSTQGELAEARDQRDAALLLNELCHY